MMRPDLVLFIAYPYPPCPAVGAVRPGHFAKYLRRMGYNVKVITAFQPDPPSDEVVFVPNRQHIPNRRTFRGLSEMVLRKLFFPSDEAMLWTYDAAAAAGELIRRHVHTVVFSTFPPLNSHMVAWKLKRTHGVRWIADFRDPLAGSPTRELTNSHIWWGPVLNSTVDPVIQRGMFSAADVLIANTDTVAEKWRTEHRTLANKIVHISNGFDPESTPGAAPAPVRERRVMSHTGSIYSGRHPGPLLESMDRLIRNGKLDPKRFLLQLIGPIASDAIRDPELFTRLKDVGCVDATGAVLPHAQARQAMCEADYLLLLDVIISGGGQQLPSKVFEYIPIGRPILAITSRNSPADRLLANSGVPYACIYSDSGPEEADRAVLDVLSRPNTPVPPSEWFLTNFDAVHRTRALASLIDGCKR